MNNLQEILAVANTTGKLPTIHFPQAQAQTQKWEMKKLSQKHKSIIALHAQGVSRADIGQVCNCTPEFVSMVIATPPAKAYLRELEQYMDSRLQSLYGRSVDVIQDGLCNEATDVQLKAARLQLEVTGKLKQDRNENQTAEDVVAALLKHATSGVVAIGQNVQVNMGDGDAGSL